MVTFLLWLLLFVLCWPLALLALLLYPLAWLLLLPFRLIGIAVQGVLGQAGAQHVDAVQGGLGGDLIVLAGEGE